MRDHLGPMSTIAAAIAVGALLFFGGLVAAAAARQRLSPPRGHDATILAVVSMSVVAAVVLRLSAAYVAAQVGVDRVLVQPTALAYLVPLAVGAFVFAVGAWVLDGAWAATRAWRYYIWLVAFAFANVINWCSPGWCLTLGFPVPWYSSSDSVINLGASEALDRVPRRAAIHALLRRRCRAGDVRIFENYVRHHA
jgi:hypothetical protein